MNSALWLVPVLPCAGFFVLALFGGRLSHRAIALIGVGTVGIATVIAIIIGIGFVASPPAGNAYLQTVWTWLRIGNFNPGIALYLDPLAVIMMLVVTFVSFVIHVYSVDFMGEDDRFAGFFAYMNLFVGSMLFLVLADNLLLLYLGWEGVGLCSYLLIGFWYQDPVNGSAARKAFIVTRVGDTAMIVGLFLLLTDLGTLRIHELVTLASSQWSISSSVAVVAALLILGGAVGKSAQIPLQTWLPDAMAGPTPVSALIHAATMVTAGVYIIARVHVLFDLAPDVRTLVAIVGAATLLIAGVSALAQRDIKRVLAYSTVSQIGYMFLGLGVGAWSPAIFHLMTHAFFKSLLFLDAGALGIAAGHSYDLHAMGGFRRSLPVVFWTFLIASASLAALPLITAGFYSKDLILWDTWAAPNGNVILWLAGIAGAFLTSLYIFRVVFLAFFGAEKRTVTWRPGPLMAVPFVTLAALSVVGGFVEIPRFLGDAPHFSNFLNDVLPAPEITATTGTEAIFAVISAVIMLVGLGLAWVLFAWRYEYVERFVASPAGGALTRFCAGGCGFDAAYNFLFVRPYIDVAEALRNDPIDDVPGEIGQINRLGNRALSLSQTGSVRWYAATIALGAVVIIAVAVFV